MNVANGPNRGGFISNHQQQPIRPSYPMRTRTSCTRCGLTDGLALAAPTSAMPSSLKQTLKQTKHFQRLVHSHSRGRWANWAWSWRETQVHCCARTPDACEWSFGGEAGLARAAAAGRRPPEPPQSPPPPPWPGRVVPRLSAAAGLARAGARAAGRRRPIASVKRGELVTAQHPSLVRRRLHL